MCLTRPVNRLARQTSSGLLQSLKPQFRAKFWQAAACPPAPGLLSFSNCEMKHVLPSMRKASRLTPLPGRQNRHLFELVCRALTHPPVVGSVQLRGSRATRGFGVLAGAKLEAYRSTKTSARLRATYYDAAAFALASRRAKAGARGGN